MNYVYIKGWCSEKGRRKVFTIPHCNFNFTMLERLNTDFFLNLNPRSIQSIQG